MTNVIPFPRAVAGIPATQIPRVEFERLADLALDIVDHIILLLDEADGDPDSEPDADREPSLAAPLGGASQVVWAAGSDDDREVSAVPTEAF
ncbi:hypothetical protein FF100_21335 [Methylobacterium terricola]|uniref:Uncharacterized protein n=1 Tax=Methylobacterium terricola TaxID=2583531 RepID=A0A5C4LF03_9HYPH|nr:hypothetical protein [Methylobacterium terricola]TNC10707.1 hypothetical protein FF100_21335 [Methylobacterium terricola]